MPHAVAPVSAAAAGPAVSADESEKERVARILAQVDDIPTLPMTVTEVLRIVDTPDCSAARLSSLVLSDPALAARVLRLANSAYYGFPRTVSAVLQAITLLGFAAVRNCLLYTSPSPRD